MSPVEQSCRRSRQRECVQVSRNPSHFRSGRRLLVAEGTLLVALGSAGFISDAMHPNAAPVGAHVLVLTMTPWHSGPAGGFGVLALIGALNRRAAIAVTGIGAVVFLVLVIVGAVSATHQAPGPLGLQPRDIVLYAVLSRSTSAPCTGFCPTRSKGPTGSVAEALADPQPRGPRPPRRWPMTSQGRHPRPPAPSTRSSPRRHGQPKHQQPNQPNNRAQRTPSERGLP